MTRAFVDCMIGALCLMIFAGDVATAGPPSGWAKRSMPGAPTVSGTVSLAASPYRDQKPLPGMAMVHVELIDISVKGSQMAVLGEDSIWAVGGKFPVTFRIAYDPSRIDPQHVYVLRARVVEGEKLLFISGPYYVLTRGSPNKADTVVNPVR